MDDIWGLDTNTEERTIDVHIKRLRTRFIENDDFSDHNSSWLRL